LAPLMMALEVSMDLLQPRLLQQIIDQGVAHHNLTIVVHTGVLMVAVALVGLAGGVGCTIFSVFAAQGLGTDMRRDLFRKVQTLSFGNLDKLETGALITRLTNDVGQVQDTVMMLLRIMVRAPLLLVGSVVMGLLTSPKLSVLFIVLMPVVMALIIVVIRKTYPMFSEVQHRLDVLNTVLQENLAGIRVVKAFVRATREMQRFSHANDRLMEQNILAVRVSAVTMPGMMLILHFGIVGTLWVGGVGVVHGEMHVGQVVAFINYLMQTLMSLMMVSMLVLRTARAEASAQRINEVMVSDPEVKSPPEPVRGFSPKGRIAFENVGFRYGSDDQDPVLKDITFVAEPGETVALLGATGSGKSSLVNLIPRFYDVSEGRVTIDGVDVRDVGEEDLHRSIGVALQESVLFSGTIRDNIRYGRPNATDEEVVEAAHMAQAHDFIEGFPEGYDTILGQRGVNLSGGQKQRLAIARALLPHPPVLILDDSTSAVDVETEARIQDALATDRHGRTCFVVAQRISTVLSADRILVLDDGRIAAQGRHEDLLVSSPIYRDIYESQMGGGEVA
jgi:ATP-binding cassette, subfamily B, multidrug efflux pump